MRLPNRGDARFPLPHEFDGRELDPFQQDAIVYLLQQTSTLVSAPTGTGKTLIADFLVDRSLSLGERVIYTGPIKALVNQKFRDFTTRFGRHSVGIVTGDVSFQEDAPIVVMTTEILRNMLLRRGHALSKVRWAIFDEIHYLGHHDRGTVWEEAILLLPDSVRILGLSATIPNADSLARWIESARDEPVGLVEGVERAVPLIHRYFNKACQAVTRDQLLAAFGEYVDPDYDALDAKAGGARPADWWEGQKGTYAQTDRQRAQIEGRKDRRRSRGGRPDQRRTLAEAIRDDTSHLDVLEYVGRNRLFPCLYFDFSRKGVREKAFELASKRRPLSQRDRETVRVTVKRSLEELGLTREHIPDLDAMEHLWQRGIGLHHAGLLPVVRRICERLLERRILKVVYATETFAVGVNMPVRSVCFDSIEKFDGRSFRTLTQHEYFQMAGRAGRRGLDRRGVSLSLTPFTEVAKGPIPEWDEAGLEAIESRFNLSFNMVANLTRLHREDEIRRLLSSTLAAFEAGEEQCAVAEELHQEFEEKKAILKRMGYLSEDRLSEKGEVLVELFQRELLVAELIGMDVMEGYSPEELAGLAAALIDETAAERGGGPVGRGGDLAVHGAGGRGFGGRGTGGRSSGGRGRRGGGRGSPMPGLVDGVRAGRWLTDVAFAEERVRRYVGNDHDDEGIGPRVDRAPLRSAVVSLWTAGEGMVDLQRTFGLDPGDVVSVCRQTIDLLRQIQRAAAGRPALESLTDEVIRRIDRDVVKVDLSDA